MEDTIFDRAAFSEMEESIFDFDNNGLHPCTDAPDYHEDHPNQAIPQNYSIAEQLLSFGSYNPHSRDLMQEETLPLHHRNFTPCEEGVESFVLKQRAVLTRCLDKCDLIQQDSNTICTTMSTENSSYMASPSTNDNEDNMSGIFGMTPSGKKSKTEYPKYAPGLIAEGVQKSICECFNGNQGAKYQYMRSHLETIIESRNEGEEFVGLMLSWDNQKNDWASVGRNLKKFGPVYASALLSCINVFLTEGGEDFETWLFNTSIPQADKCSLFTNKEKLAEAFWKKFKI